MRSVELTACTVDLATGALSGGRTGRLATRELTLLAWLAERPGQVVSRDELLVRAFGYSAAAQSRAVDKAMNSLRAKVERDPAAPDHLVTVTGVGYRFVGPVAPAVPEAARATDGDPLVGREEALLAVRALLAEPGVVTLVGPAGVGKTRLAAAASTGRFVALASARGRDDVCHALAAALELPLQTAGPEATDAIGRAIAALGDATLVLDNLEHLLAWADLIDRWRFLAPRARLLVTSREELRLAGERTFRVEPLPPADAAALLALRAAQRGWDVSSEPSLPRLAARLDGLPLALELAAARLGTLGVDQLLERLDDRLSLLRARDPRAEPRHASLARALDGSWSLLQGAEQTALAELSVFPADFTVEAAEAVLSPPADGRTALDVLERLLEASLLRRRTVEGRVRLGLLEVVRLYAAERLAALAPASARRAEDAHAAHYAALGARLKDGRGPDGPAERRRLAREIDHLRSACRHAARDGRVEVALDACEGAAAVLLMHGPLDEAVALAREVAALPGATLRQRARAELVAGQVLRRLDPRQARDALERAIRGAVEGGADAVADAARFELAVLLAESGETAAARALFEDGLRSADPLVAALCTNGLGIVARLAGRLDEAMSLTTRAVDEARRLGDLRRVAMFRSNLAAAHLQRGELDESQRLLEECVRGAEACGDRTSAVRFRGTLAQVMSLRGDVPSAVRVQREVADELLAIGATRERVPTLVMLADALSMLDRHDEALACYDEAEALGRSLADATAEAMALHGTARVLLSRTRPAEAADRLRRARALLAPLGVGVAPVFVAVALAEALHRLGDRDEALALLDEADERVAALGCAPDAEVRRDAARVRGLVAQD